MNVEKLIDIAKAIGDKSRLRMLCAVMDCPLCVHQLSELTNLDASTVSRHLNVLNKAGLVKCLKQGKWSFYVVSENSGDDISDILNFVKTTVGGATEIIEDKDKIKKLREEYCDLHHEFHESIREGGNNV